MSAPTLFDAPPLARASDPSTAHLAAATMKPASRELIACIRWWLGKQSEPKSAFDIAQAIAGNRWSDATVRTACSRAGLRAIDTDGRSPRGQRCIRYGV